MISSQLSRPRGSRHLLVRGFVAGAVAAMGLIFGGCATQPSARNVETFVAKAPRPKLVARDQVMAAAEQEAAKHEGDFVLHGFGRSMEPVYLAGTAVVVHPTAMHMLRKGMAVVYRNPRGMNVAHMLLERTERGWIAIGLNNAEPDGTLVTEKNLVGIIKHAFAADDTPFRSDIAAQITLKPTLERGASFALLH
jgi:hypothetical protein